MKSPSPGHPERQHERQHERQPKRKPSRVQSDPGLPSRSSRSRKLLLKTGEPAAAGFAVADASTVALPQYGPQYGVSDLKARCLEIISNVAERGDSCIITKHGVPVARIVPIAGHTPTLKGCLRDGMTIVGDIVHCDFGDDWEAAR